MKKLTIALTLLMGVYLTAGAQTAPAKEKKTKSTKEAAMKDHVCTAACKDGKHAYAHGEKGHTCTAECHKPAAKKTM